MLPRDVMQRAQRRRRLLELPMPVRENARVRPRGDAFADDQIVRLRVALFAGNDLENHPAGAAFDERDAAVQAQFAIYCKTYAAGKTTLPRPEREGNRLGNLELYYKLLDLYYSFAKTFGFQWDQEWLMEEKEVVAEEINYLLVHDLKKRGASCRRCGGPIALDSPYSICDKCYRKQRQERERQRRYWDIYA